MQTIGDFLRSNLLSPYIDAGDPDLDGDGLEFTLDSDDRDPDGTRFDLGAYPYFQSPTVQISGQVSNPTSISNIPLGIEFSAYVSGFDETDIETNNGLITSFTGEGYDYQIVFTPASDGPCWILFQPPLMKTRIVYPVTHSILFTMVLTQP